MANEGSYLTLKRSVRKYGVGRMSSIREIVLGHVFTGIVLIHLIFILRAANIVHCKETNENYDREKNVEVLSIPSSELSIQVIIGGII